MPQSYSIAKNVFEHVESGTIKFVLIGLSPYILPKNDSESLVAWDVKTNTPVLEDYFKLCLDNGAKPVVVVLPVHSSLKKNYNADVLKTFRDTINQVVKKFQSSAFIDLLNVNINNNCFYGNSHFNSEGAAAVSALLGLQLYFKNIVSAETIYRMDNKYFDVLKNFFPDDCKSLMHHTFCRIACDDFNRLSKTMPKNTCLELIANVFSEMTYNHLANLSDMLSKDDYSDLAARVFEISAEKIRHKKKIKVGFFFRNPSMWCGDDLYNFFARDERFEPTVFFYPFGDELMRKEFIISFEKFKAHGINLFEVKNINDDIPAQDVLFQIMPYDEGPLAFRLKNLKVTTLMTHFNYGIAVTQRIWLFNSLFFRVLWRVFCSSKFIMEVYQKFFKFKSRGFYSGYPRMDVFFKNDSKFHFDWKMAHPDAKKIIWAPHHTIKKVPWSSLSYSTFLWNYQFMYEFAKAHPEISWVFKPHPALVRALNTLKIFPSVAACEEYFQKWDDLSNAQVYWGAYYQAVFVTSDGMIQDSSSFIAEYQYVNKPMIYLTRDTQNHNELSKEILRASYCVDGKDLDGIAAMIQRVFIEGDDYKAAERKVVFDKYLNYPKDNGMLASEFIYKKIIEELGLSKCKQ